jgi:hypothetical protein
VENNNGLIFDYSPLGRMGKVSLTARLPDGASFTDKVEVIDAEERDRYLTRLCEDYRGINRKEAAAELELIASRVMGQPQEGEASRKGKPSQPDQLLDRADNAELLAQMPKDVSDEVDALLTDRLLIQRVVDDVAALNVAGEKELTATIYLIGVSRLLDRPLNGIVQGPSTSRKSYLIEKTASLFPAETLILATQMTPQALFHMRPGTLAHRFVVAGERSRIEDDERAEATRALREMLSAGKLTKLMPMKVEGGRIETVQIEQDGPIAYVESTTLTKVFDEDANRCLLLHTDERPEQTRRIVRQLAKAYGNTNGMEASRRIILRHHALQRMLQPLPVVIPYAERLGELIPSDRVEVRRAFPQLMSMIQAVSLLHQRQRNRNGDGALVATEEDYQLARHLLLKPMARLLGGGLADPTRRFHERLSAWAKGEFTTTEAKRREQSSKSAVSGWLAELHDVGFVELVEASRGRTPATWRLADPAHDANVGNLPAIKEVFPDLTWTHGRKAEMA